VNYFGHAAVASWQPHAEPGGLALGAMLPDFASMCGGRLAPSEDAAVAAGVDLHHRTDGVFHPLPVVLALMRELDERLARRGCARGPRRAVAHIGVELLLDCVLVEEAAYRASYLAAIARGPTSARWHQDDHAARFAALHLRLAGYGVPDDLRRPDAITTRLQRILGPRPRLAPAAADLVAIRASLVEHQGRVEVSADEVLRGVRAALAT
jgi:hypothetical protein